MQENVPLIDKRKNTRKAKIKFSLGMAGPFLTFWKQVYLLLWKNFRLRRRQIVRIHLLLI